MHLSIKIKIIFLIILSLVMSCKDKVKEAREDGKETIVDSLTNNEENNQITIDPTASLIDSTAVEPKVYSTKLETVSDFENSMFFEKYTCYNDGSWRLQNGLLNNSYGGPGISIDLSTSNMEIKHLGLTIYNKYYGLEEKDFNLINDLIDAFKFSGNTNRIKSYINKNIEKSVEQIKKAIPISSGKYKIWAGKVIQQTLVIEKE